MDLDKTNEARNRRREEALARRMGEALDQISPAVAPGRSSEPCPDAEQIAAYHERSLGPEEAARYETHFAGCGRCRKILAVLAAADTPLAENEVAQLGKRIAAARAPSTPPLQALETGYPRPRHHLDWRIRWLAPALGVAAALAAWFAIRPPWRALEQHPSGSLVAQGSQNEGLPAATAAGAPGEERALSAIPAQKQDANSQASSPTPKPDSAPRGNAIQSQAELSANADAYRDAVTRARKAEAPFASGSLKSESANVDSAGAAQPSPASAPPVALLRSPAALPAASAPASAPVVPLIEMAGTVKDASGGAVSGAVVTVRDMDTGIERTGLTMADGSYRFSALPGDHYQVNVTKDGFESATRSGITLVAGAQTTVDLTLQVGSTGQTVTVTGEAPQVDTRSAPAIASTQAPAPNLPLNGRNFQATAKLQSAATIAIQVPAPSGRVLWRVGKDGRIERSIDGGKAWALQASPSREDWLAGAAVSERVCWVAGRNGAIARTTDGEHWEKIAPPSVSADPSGKLPDWIAVTASDAQTATVTAAGQRRFATQDGGKTWRAQ